MEKQLDVTKSYKETELQEIGNQVRNGKIVVFPTETVYGIGANGLDEKAVEKVYQIKQRKKENPINLLVSDENMINQVAQNITLLEWKLMETFFPGPFTMILTKKPCVPAIVTANQDMVGVRMPSGEIARKLVRYANTPIAAPSANLSGKPSGTNIEDILEELSEQVDFVINGGESEIGIESTIVKVINGVPHILRPGAIIPEQIKQISGCVVLDYEKKENKELPSQQENHYQIQTKCVLVYDDNHENLIKKIQELLTEEPNQMILTTKEDANEFPKEKVIILGEKTNFKQISKNLYTNLRKADELHAKGIIVQGIEKKGLGVAIMDRLSKICETCYLG